MLAPTPLGGGFEIEKTEEGYVLRGTALDGLPSLQDAERSAQEFLKRLGAAFLVARHEALSISTAGKARAVDSSGKERRYQTFLSPTTFTLRVISGDELALDAFVAPWMRLSDTDASVQRVFALIASGPQSWNSLFAIKEVVEADVHDLIANYVPRAALKRFDRTANHPYAAGLGARHAVSHADPPRPPMPLPEATDLILKMVRCWVQGKTT